MPTGYTACIEKDATFAQFLWGCVRALGICASMRDDSYDKRIPEEFKINPYYEDKIRSCQKRYEEFKAMNASEWQASADKEYQEAIRNRQPTRDQIKMQNQFEKMRSQVLRWVPPTPGHTALKDFMLQQIALEDSSFAYRAACGQHEVSRRPWKVLKGERLLNASEDLKSAQQELKEHQESVAKSNKWLADLRNSVKQP